MKHGMISFRTCQPDFSELPEFQFDCEALVYGNVHEDNPKEVPKPLINFVTLSHYDDANLYHDMTLGCSVTGIFHLVNQTHIK